MDIIILTETWLHSGISSSELFPNQFNVFRCDRQYSKGGGTLIAVNTTRISVQPLNLVSPVQQIDLVGVRVFLKKDGMLIITIYIPPGLPISCYEQMFEYLENTVDFSEPILIIGDFNIPELIECEIGTRTTQMFNIYSHFLSLNDLKQRNKVCNSFSKLLDLVLSTDSLALEVWRHEYPLVDEDAHHPCLRIDVTTQGEPDVMFQRQTDFTKCNFYKGDLEGLGTVSLRQGKIVEYRNKT